MNADGTREVDRLLLDITGVEELTGLSRRTIHRLRKLEKFPKPKRVPTGGNRWTKTSIVRWAERLDDAEVRDE
jgi:predicted DNA-binding transcriptional regulator AlpA